MPYGGEAVTNLIVTWQDIKRLEVSPIYQIHGAFDDYLPRICARLDIESLFMPLIIRGDALSVKHFIQFKTLAAFFALGNISSGFFLGVD